MYNNYMYAIDRSDDYLAHYGVKGMRWGVRKAIERGDRAALSRHYRKATMKLAKLSMNANRELSQKRYDTAKKRMVSGAVQSAGLSAGLTAGVNTSRGVRGRQLLGATGAAAVAGALGGALINSKGIMAKRHLSDVGHARAVAKRDQWQREMNETFKNSGIAPSNKEMKQFHRQISGLSNTRNPSSYVKKMQSNAAAGNTNRSGTGRTFGQLSAKEQRQVAQGLAKLQNRFEGHYQQGLARGMNHAQAEAYANKRLNGTQPRKRRRS